MTTACGKKHLTPTGCQAALIQVRFSRYGTMV